MSSGDAGVAGDAGQAQQGTEGQGEQQGAPDYGAMMEQMQSIAQSQEDMRGYLQSNPWQAQEEQAPENEGLEAPDLGFLETGDPQADQDLAQGLQNLITTQAQQQVQQAVGPLQEQLQQFQRMDAARELVQEIPQLNEPEHAQRIVGVARQYAEMMGRPELADEPQMWRLIHYADAAMVAAKEEQETSPAAHIEGGGGAGAGQQSGVDLGDLIVNGQGEGAPLGRRVLPF